MTRKEITIGSVRYAAIASAATVAANLFLAPTFGFQKPTLEDALLLGLFGLVASFLFFFVVFTLAARFGREDEE